MTETYELFDPFLGKTVQISHDLVNRLRGKYARGPVMSNGEPEFGWRQFDGLPPIQAEAADVIETLRFALESSQLALEKVRDSFIYVDDHSDTALSSEADDHHFQEVCEAINFNTKVLRTKT